MEKKELDSKKLLSVRKNQRGASMVEYTLLLSFIAIVAVVNLAGAGQDVYDKILWLDIKWSLANAGVGW